MVLAAVFLLTLAWFVNIYKTIYIEFEAGEFNNMIKWGE